MRRAILFVAALTFTCGVIRGAELSFRGIGDLPGGNRYSRPEAVSNGGTVVVGASSLDRQLDGFRWTPADGIQSIESDAGWRVRNATDVTPDGSVVLGWASGSAPAPIRWTEAGGFEFPMGVPTIPAVSADVFSADDGVTLATSLTNGEGRQAVRFTPQDGIQELGDFPEGPLSSESRGISGDGGTIVGYGYAEIGPKGFRWTEAGGLEGLGEFPSGYETQIAEAASGDGSVIVGLAAATQPDFFRAFRWTTFGGAQLLSRSSALDEVQDAVAWDVSADGRLIVGQDNVLGAFLWSEAKGMQSVETVLSRKGLGNEVSGWILTQATAISADGQTIAGLGYSQGYFQGWVATIPEPSTAWLAVSGIAALAFARRRGAAR